MTSNPIVRKLSFTDSTEVGRVVIEQCSATIKKSRQSWSKTHPNMLKARTGAPTPDDNQGTLADAQSDRGDFQGLSHSL